MKRGPKPKPAEEKLVQLTIRISKDEAQMLDTLATLHGGSASQIARFAIRSAWSNVTPAQKRALANLLKVREESLK